MRQIKIIMAHEYANAVREAGSQVFYSDVVTAIGRFRGVIIPGTARSPTSVIAINAEHVEDALKKANYVEV